MPTLNEDLPFPISIKRICHDSEFSEEETKEQLLLLHKERILSLQMMKDIESKSLLRAGVHPLIVRSVNPPAADDLAFPINDDESLQEHKETKKWLKTILRANNWPAHILKEDSKSLKRVGIRLMRSMHLLTKEDWEMIDIPLGVKLCIEHYMKKDKLCYSFEEMKVEEAPEESTLDRITVRTETGETYEVDRYCPHKGADLSKAKIEGETLICPKHKWRFELDKGGVCTSKDGCSINAARVDW